LFRLSPGAPPKAEPEQREHTAEELANMSELDRLAVEAGPWPKPDNTKADEEALQRWNDDLDRQAAYREEVHRERVKALREGGMRIDEPVRELKWNK